MNEGTIRVKAGTFISSNAFLTICKEFDVILDSFLLFSLDEKCDVDYQYKFNINYNMDNVVEFNGLDGLKWALGA